VRSAIQVLGLHVLDHRLFEIKQAIMFPAVMMIGTLYVVLSLRVGAPKVDATIVADPVGIGILIVLLQRSDAWERSLAANTVRHRMVVVRDKEGSWPWEIDLEFT
jgi:hydrogenase/urease accessory protein HupE